MAEIFDIRKARQDRAVPEASYFLRVDMYDDGIHGVVLDLGSDLDADTLRMASNHLATLSRYLGEQATEMDGKDDLLAMAWVFKDSRVRVYCRDEIQTVAQFSWLDERFNDAKEAARKDIQ